MAAILAWLQDWLSALVVILGRHLSAVPAIGVSVEMSCMDQGLAAALRVLEWTALRIQNDSEEVLPGASSSPLLYNA